jgi:soluble lytic murein transglycosylase-like protein
MQHSLRKAAAFILGFIGTFVLAALVFKPSFAADTIPPEAARYKLTLKREAQRVWGIEAPVATFAAQVHQESRWRPDARSPVGAHGLAQFMPATARWMGAVAPQELQAVDTSNPTWSLRALVTYDQWLSQRIQADSPCERIAFTLSAYNGGLGWAYKRQRMSPQPGKCLGATCTINPGIQPANQRENELYPRLILQRYEPLYAQWGTGSCA